MPHTLYFDRKRNAIDGVLTLRKSVRRYLVANNCTTGHTDSVETIFEQLPARSGQRGFTETDWVVSKSPIPFGRHWLTCAPVPLWMEPVGTPFFMISSKKGTGIINGPDGKKRTAVGLHLENNLPGSAGCVVLLWDTEERKKAAFALFDYLKKLRNEEPFIEFVVL